jgi:hypothetical protein
MESLLTVLIFAFFFVEILDCLLGFAFLLMIESGINAGASSDLNCELLLLEAFEFYFLSLKKTCWRPVFVCG